MTKRQIGGRMDFLYAVLRVHRTGEITEEIEEKREKERRNNPR